MAYAAQKRMNSESAQSDVNFRTIDDFAKMLSGESSYVRTCGFVLLCAQAKWDEQGRMMQAFDKMIPLLNDSKPTVIRQCQPCRKRPFIVC